MSDERGWDARGELLLLGGATLLLAVLPVALLFAPIPLAALVLRHGLRAGIGTALLSGLVASVVSFEPLILAQVLLVLALGIALGEGLREKLTATQLVIVGTVVSAVTTLLLKIVVEQVVGQPLEHILAEFWQEVLNAPAGNGNGVSTESAAALIAQMQAVFPASLLLGSSGLTILNFSLVTKVLDRLPGGEKPSQRLAPFSQWRFHKAVSAVFVIGWLVGMGWGRAFEEPGSIPFVPMVLANVTFLLSTLLAVQGIAVVWHFLRRTRLSPFFAGILIAVALIMPVLPLVFLLIGVVDGWVDLRKFKKEVIKS